MNNKVNNPEVNVSKTINMNEKNYLEVSGEKELFIKKESSNYYFIEQNKNGNIDKKILIGEGIKEFKLDSGYLYYVKRNLVKEKDELYRLGVNKNELGYLFGD